MLRRADEPADGVGASRIGGARPPTEVTVAYIDEHRDRLGVEPICRVLTDAGTQIARAHRLRGQDPPALGTVDQRRGDDRADPADSTDKCVVHGARKVHAELHRQGHRVARCIVWCLMRRCAGPGCAGSPERRDPHHGPEAVHDGSLPSVRVGRRILIPRNRLLGWPDAIKVAAG